MSKQNRRINYTNYSSKKLNDESQNIVAEEPVESVEVIKPIGTVVGCEKLNVRKEPSINSDVVYQFPSNMEVEILIDKSTEDWFYVCNAAGIEGYCMKTYIDSSK